MHDQRSSRKGIDNQIVAQEFHSLATKNDRIPYNVIDDGCHERTEAFIALAMTAGLPVNSLRRVFLVNLGMEPFQATKPSYFHTKLKSWFTNQEQAKRLVPNAKFGIGEEGINKHYFSVDEHKALRSTVLPTIYLDDSQVARWGVCHIAPMIGDFVVDLGVADGPIHFHNWKKKIQAKNANIIPITTSPNQSSELAVDLISLEHCELILNKMPPQIVTQSRVNSDIETVKRAYSLLDTKQKTTFFNKLFFKQIKSGAILPYENWSEISPTYLTTRGEKFNDNILDARNTRITKLAEYSWNERYDLALKALEPFTMFEKLILNQQFTWQPPNHPE